MGGERGPGGVDQRRTRQRPGARPGGLTSALYLFLVGLLVLVVGAAVLFPATSIFAGILGGALMLIGGNALIGGAIITGLRR